VRDSSLVSVDTMSGQCFRTMGVAPLLGRWIEEEDAPVREPYSEDDVARLFDVGSSLGEKLGPLLWQLAPFRKFNADDLGAFLSLLPRKANGRPLSDFLQFVELAISTINPALRKVHQKFPMIKVWDDHEMQDNYAGGEAGYTGTSPVTAFPPNGFGIYDAGGNIWQWCADWYRPDAYSTLAASQALARNPTGPSDSFDPDEPGQLKRVVRGGSYLCSDHYCTRYLVGSRGKAEPTSNRFSVCHTSERPLIGWPRKARPGPRKLIEWPRNRSAWTLVLASLPSSSGPEERCRATRRSHCATCRRRWG